MTASSNDGHQAGYWGGFDAEDAVDFTRSWLTDSPGPSRSQQLATWLDTRQARVKLLPAEAALEPGYIRLRHGTMQPDTFRLHPGQFFATGADTGYGYAWSPGRPDGAVIPVDVPRTALQQASMDTPMPHARPGHRGVVGASYSVVYGVVNIAKTKPITTMPQRIHTRVDCR